MDVLLKPGCTIEPDYYIYSLSPEDMSVHRYMVALQALYHTSHNEGDRRSLSQIMTLVPKLFACMQILPDPLYIRLIPYSSNTSSFINLLIEYQYKYTTSYSVYRNLVNICSIASEIQCLLFDMQESLCILITV